MEGGLSLEGGEVKAWDVDLGEFLNDVEEDPDAATMLGTANEFDLDAEGSSADDPSQSADLASSQAGDSMFDKSAGPGDSSFFGEEVDQNANPTHGRVGDAFQLSIHGSDRRRTLQRLAGHWLNMLCISFTPWRTPDF